MSEHEDLHALSEERRQLLVELLAAEGIDLSQQIAISPRTRSETAPLSFAQQRLWFLDRWEPESAQYTVQLVFLLEGEVQAQILARCVQALVQRHEILRTLFVQIDGQPVQRILSTLPPALVHDDLGHLPVTCQEPEARRLLREEGQRPFQLSTGSLLRLRLIRLHPQRHLLSLTMHHLVIDEWSLPILLHELSALYQAFSQGQPSPLPPLPIQYADYACWQRDWQHKELLSRHLQYWQRQLADLPEQLALPTDLPRPATPHSQGALFRFQLPAELSAGLLALCQQEEVTLFMLLLATLQVLLSRYSGQKDIVWVQP